MKVTFHVNNPRDMVNAQTALNHFIENKSYGDGTADVWGVRVNGTYFTVGYTRAGNYRVKQHD